MTLQAMPAALARLTAAAAASLCLGAMPAIGQEAPDIEGADTAGIGQSVGFDEGATRTRYLNPVIERLANGQPFIGVSTADLSPEHAKALARAPIDYVYVDFEHNPMDLGELYRFSLATIDRAAINERGNLQSDIAIFARFRPYGREQVEWISKQALDLGLMGIIFNSINNAEEATRRMRRCVLGRSTAICEFGGVPTPLAGRYATSWPTGAGSVIFGFDLVWQNPNAGWLSRR